MIGLGLFVPEITARGMKSVSYPGAALVIDAQNGIFKAVDGSVHATYAAMVAAGKASFARAGVGTALNRANAVVNFASGAPRETDRGLFTEVTATNLWKESQTVDSASWGKVTCTIMANVTMAPDGTMTADSFVEDSAAISKHSLVQSITAIPATTYTISGYIKANGRTRIKLVDNSSLSGLVTTFDLTAVTASAALGTASITPMADGWFYVISTVTTGASQTVFNLHWRLDNGTTDTYLGDGASGIYLWGLQTELGAVATSYIPTTGAAATRAFDDATITDLGGLIGTGLSYTLVTWAWMNGQDGLEVSPLFVGDSTLSANRILFRRNTANQMTLIVRNASVPQGTLPVYNGITGPRRVKCAIAVTPTSYQMVMDGVASTKQTGINAPVGMDRLKINNGSFGGPIMNGFNERTIIYPYAMTQAEMIGATS